MSINIWLKNFKENWQNHNINGVLSLFDKNIIYYETPFIKLNNFDALVKEWKIIKNQPINKNDDSLIQSLKNNLKI